MSTTGAPASATAAFSSRLSAADALLWQIERDPCLRTTIVAVSVLDRAPDWARLRARIGFGCEQVPRLRQRVVEPSLGIGGPRWQDDDQFDLDYHLRHVAVPPPCDDRDLLDIAGGMAMTPFDKARPLWEFVLVTGLSDGRAALIQKIHHSITDGVGAVHLAQLLLDRRRAGGTMSRPVPRTPHSASGALSSLTDSVAGDLRATASAIVRSVRDPIGFVSSTTKGVRSIAKLVAPVHEPLSPIMRGRGLSRRLDTFDIETSALLDAAHAADSSLNDAFLAAIGGGLHRYHQRHGTSIDSLRVTMPINMRRAGDAPGSNRFTPARFTMPVDDVDAMQRMQRLGALARAWRSEPSLPLSDAIAAILTHLPVAASVTLLGGMLKAIDVVATNVPGLTERAYLAGAEVTREYAFAPPSGAALSVALLSHGAQCCIGINTDTAAISDPEVLTACLLEGFDDVLAVTR